MGVVSLAKTQVGVSLIFKPIKEGVGTCPALEVVTEVTDIETAARWSNFQI
jgi:hypothetical protein